MIDVFYLNNRINDYPRQNFNLTCIDERAETYIQILNNSQTSKVPDLQSKNENLAQFRLNSNEPIVCTIQAGIRDFSSRCIGGSVEIARKTYIAIIK